METCLENTDAVMPALHTASAKEPGFQKEASSKKTGRAINKRDAGNATKAGELGILCFLSFPNPRTIFIHATNLAANAS